MLALHVTTRERPDRGRNCGTCDFWQMAGDTTMKPPWPGSCRNRAPEPAGFPATTNEDWCADYAACDDAF